MRRSRFFTPLFSPKYLGFNFQALIGPCQAAPAGRASGGGLGGILFLPAENLDGVLRGLTDGFAFLSFISGSGSIILFSSDVLSGEVCFLLLLDLDAL